MTGGGMKITRSRLRQLIKEEVRALREYTRNPMERYYAGVVEDYEAWVQEKGHVTPGSSSVLVTYLIDQGLEQDTERIGILASEYKMDKIDVAHELKSHAGKKDTDQDGVYDFADSDKDDDGVVDATQGLRDIVHARIGEIYEEDVLEADLAIWLAKNQEFTLVEPGKSYSGWWGTDTIDDAAWYVDGPEEGPKETFTMSNYGPTNEGTPVDEMPASWQQILRDVV